MYPQNNLLFTPMNFFLHILIKNHKFEWDKLLFFFTLDYISNPSVHKIQPLFLWVVWLGFYSMKRGESQPWKILHTQFFSKLLCDSFYF
jgi:hypothetical protein